MEQYKSSSGKVVCVFLMNLTKVKSFTVLMYLLSFSKKTEKNYDE